jgi:hypothetical protein
MRAVNQAIGRAIRHRTDYAAIILMDERFAGFQNMLSKWIRSSVKVVQQWTGMLDELREFYTRHTYEGLDGPVFQPELIVAPRVKKSVESKEKCAAKERREGLSCGRNQEEEKLKHEARHLCNPNGKKKTREADGVLMQKELERLFATSRTDSEVGVRPILKSVNEARVVEKVSVVIREPPKCAYCKETDGRLRRMPCGHFACNECLGFREALGNLACPICP